MSKNKDLKNLSLDEASDFWDEHDFGEFDDTREVNDLQFCFKKKKYVGIDKDLYEHIKTRARELQKSEENLINEWLAEKARV